MTVFIIRGETPPLSTRKANERGERYFNSQLKQWEREAGILTKNAQYLAWAAEWLQNNITNADNNRFNHRLAAYKKAIARLNKYRLAIGQPEETHEVETGDLDDDLNPIMKTDILKHQIEPLVAEIEQDVFDEQGEKIGTELIANSLIAQDDAERAKAQAIVDATPQDVIDFLSAQQAGQ